MTTQISTFEVTAPFLRSNGYLPIPIIPGTKRPAAQGWTEEGFDPHPGHYTGFYTGIATSHTPVIDIDVSEATVVAQIRAIVKDVTGGVVPLSRTGMAPRVALLFRTLEPFEKQTTAEYSLTTDPTIDGKLKRSRVEVLCKGQQIVVEAIHPTTARPYVWADNITPLHVPRGDLPLLSLEQAIEIVKRCDALLAQHGERTSAMQINGEQHVPNAELVAKDPIECIAALDAIPNNDAPYDDYIYLLLAAKGALGEGGLDTFRRHSQKSQKHDESTFQQQWAKAKPKAIGAGTIYHLARQSGWNNFPTAAEVFGANQLQASPSYCEAYIHQLAKFVDFDGTAKPPRWVIPGFIGHGVVVISGAPGVGKTTALLPLAMTAAGLHGDAALLPVHWRHVVYVTEDIEQAKRIIAGIVGYGGLGITLEAVRERVHLVEAVRLDPPYVAQVGKLYREKFTRVVNGVEVLALVVFDTKSAVLALDNENDNAEASDVMATLKQNFEGQPLWLVGHVAKPNLNRSDVSGLTSRGASAIEGDANQTIFLIRDGDSRYLLLGKTRFEPTCRELEITSRTATAPGNDEFGEPADITMRWGIASLPLQSRKQAAEQDAERAKQVEGRTLRQNILDAVEHGWQLGNPLNRAGVKAQVSRKGAVVGLEIEKLLSEGLLHEVPVPAAIRTNPKRAAFLVSVTAEEHSANAGLPAAKQVIPASWRKPPIPSVPGALPNA